MKEEEIKKEGNEKEEKNKKEKVEIVWKKLDKKMISNLIVIAGLFFAIGFFVSFQGFFDKEKRSHISMNEAKERTEIFITENLVQPGTEIKVKGVSEEKGLYKINLELMGQEIDSYLSKDGKFFFPEAMDIGEIEEQAQAMKDQETEKNKEIPKNSKPVVEAFVMSYCPYGTQIQKGLLPVVDLLKDKIDFDFKFVDYAMHDKEEIDENLVQYCANEADQAKYHQYLKCFLSKEDSEACLVEAQINQNTLNQCITKTDVEYEITKKYEDKANWGGQFPPFDIQKEENEKYGVQGSPTLIVNGVEANSSRDPQSLLSAICEAFEEQPAECQQELSSETPAPGFGDGTTVSGANAECGE
jgi:protein-disulfide isomerase